jgi:hypothetical protein
MDTWVSAIKCFSQRRDDHLGTGSCDMMQRWIGRLLTVSWYVEREGVLFML